MNLIDVTRQFGTPKPAMISSNGCVGRMARNACTAQAERVTKYTKKASARQRLNTKTGEMETKTVPARILYVCLDCKKQFSVGDGTIFNDTHLSLDSRSGPSL